MARRRVIGDGDGWLAISIRLLTSLGLVWLVWRESGPFTALAILLIFARWESLIAAWYDLAKALTRVLK